jgi:hypothetical protein
MDFTGVYAFLQQHKSRLVLIPLGILLFAAGWQTGRVTSPYYALHPIVFEDRQCPESCGNSGGTAAELEALKKAGQGSAVAEIAATPPAASPAVPESTVAGTATSAGKFVGSINSDLFHDPSCAAASRIKEANQVWFASVGEAEAAGYSPSECTKDKLNLTSPQ